MERDEWMYLQKDGRDVIGIYNPVDVNFRFKLVEISKFHEELVNLIALDLVVCWGFPAQPIGMEN